MPKIVPKKYLEPIGRQKWSLPRYDLYIRDARDQGNFKVLSKIFEQMPLTGGPSAGPQRSLGTIAFLDVETTGLKIINGHGAIEVFALLTDFSLEPTGYFYSLVRPDARVSYNAYRTHDWNNPHLANVPSAEKVYPALEKFLDDALRANGICGYNIGFDLGFLTPQFSNQSAPYRMIDVLDIVKLLFPKKENNLDSHKLGYMIKALDIPGIDAENLHSPVEDVKAVFLLYDHLFRNYRQELKGYKLNRGPAAFLFVPPAQETQREIDFSSSLESNLAALGFEKEGNYLRHPFLQDETFLAKEYQIEYAARALEDDLALGLDTSLGKLNISLLSAVSLLSQSGSNKPQAIYLIPRLEIIANHLKECKRFLRDIEVRELSSKVSSNKQQRNLEEADILFGTPETVYKLSQEGRIKWDRVALLAVDEAHKINEREEGRKITEIFREQGSGRVLIMTATPGADRGEALALMHDFGLPRGNLYVRERESEVVNFPYVREIESIKIESPPVAALEKRLQALMVKSVDEIFRQKKYFDEDRELVRSVQRINSLPEFDEAALRGMLEHYFSTRYENSRTIEARTREIIEKAKSSPHFKRYLRWELYASITSKYYTERFRKFLEALKKKDKISREDFYFLVKESAKVGTLNHLLQFLILGQPYEFYQAFKRFWENKRGRANIVELKREGWIQQIKGFLSEGIEYEAFPDRREFFRDYRIEEIERFNAQYKLPGEKVLVLVRLRERAKHVAEALKEKGIKCKVLWGAGSRDGKLKGITPRQKKRILQKFSQGDSEILVATEDVLGLGVTLDIDFLLIDTPPLSPKKFVQQLGRAARTKDGKAYYLIGSHPTEEHFAFARRYAARRMKRDLGNFPA